MKSFSEYFKTLQNPSGAAQGKTPQQPKALLKSRFQIQKSNDNRMLTFGWANVSLTEEGGEMHERGDAAALVESMVFTIVGQLQSGNFSLSREGYQEMKADYMDFLITVVDILDNAAYLFEKEVPSNRRNWKAKVELEQFRTVLKGTQGKAEIWNGQKENILAFSSLYPYTLVKVRTGGDIHGKIIRWRSISGKRRGDCGG